MTGYGVWFLCTFHFSYSSIRKRALHVAFPLAIARKITNVDTLDFSERRDRISTLF
jgi:hypothetical protein